MKLTRKIRQWIEIRKTKLVPEKEWITVFQSMNPIQVQIQQIALEDEGIPVMVFNQRDSSYNAFGYIYLNVRKEDEEIAKSILSLTHE